MEKISLVVFVLLFVFIVIAGLLKESNTNRMPASNKEIAVYYEPQKLSYGQELSMVNSEY